MIDRPRDPQSTDEHVRRDIEKRRLGHAYAPPLAASLGDDCETFGDFPGPTDKHGNGQGNGLLNNAYSGDGSGHGDRAGDGYGDGYSHGHTEGYSDGYGDAFGDGIGGRE